VSTGDPVLDGWLHAASWLFLAGVLMVIGSAVPVLARRFPRLLVQGFLLTIAALGVALVAALTRG
jgi:hypothetical protein